MNVRTGGWRTAGIALTMLGCSFLDPAGKPPEEPDPKGYVRIEPTDPERLVDDEDEDEEAEARAMAELEVRSFNHERRKRSLAERFPGLEHVDFVRFLVVPNQGAEACRTEVSPPWKMGIEIEWEIDGDGKTASGVTALKEAGWWPTYRSPRGFGIERRADFDRIDARVATEFACACGREGELEWQPVELRLLWEREQMPQVSAAVGKGTGRRGLSPASTFGHYLTWDFAAQRPFPVKNPARCGLTASVVLSARPPIL